MARHGDDAKQVSDVLPTASTGAFCVRVRAALMPCSPAHALSTDTDEGPFFTDGPFAETKG